jgi:hypothetical protein
MRLWTWQKEEFDISDKYTPVKIFKYSDYIHKARSEEESQLFKRQYAELIKRLKTSQFHWYFADENDAKRESSHLQWFNQGCVLWEVEVPVGEVLKMVCSIAWNCLLELPILPPKRLFDDWPRLPEYNEGQEKNWQKDFHNFWKNKSRNELWDLLFLNTYVDGCTDILLDHPLESNWIVKNPIKDGKWWELLKYSPGPKIYDCPLPCDECPGRLHK